MKNGNKGKFEFCFWNWLYCVLWKLKCYKICCKYIYPKLFKCLDGCSIGEVCVEIGR